MSEINLEALHLAVNAVTESLDDYRYAEIPAHSRCTRSFDRAATCP